ncbi:helix-turn-helix transcriptional regulator [Nocardioides yefusunii]|uniref:LuxR C-terminal-related transcriptional regulator n=1 Tax=Nocardioides yefusunii TaxID=2500546 RepID=A0ABW1QY13_9ACTN|nr:LuxR C-terminal-related transcriptional regulator [Nocardioides yefusunii]
MTTTQGPSQREEAHALICRLLPERLQRLHRASGLPVVFGGAIRWDGTGARLVISRLVGAQGDGLDGLVIEPGRGLGGRVIKEGTEARVDLYADNDEITHDFDSVIVDQERLTSLVAVPVMVQGLVQGVLYGGNRDNEPVSMRAIRSAHTVARGLQRDVEKSLRGEPAPAGPNPRAALADLARLIAETPDPAMRMRLNRIHADLGGSLPPQRPDFAELTPREIDVLRIVGFGATNVEVAAELGLSPETVKAYLRSTMRKLGASNRTIAARTAVQWGLLDK